MSEATLSDVVGQLKRLGHDIKQDHQLEDRMRDMENRMRELEIKLAPLAVKLDIAMKLLWAVLMVVIASTLNSIFGFIGG